MEELSTVNKEYDKLKKIVGQGRSVEVDIQHQLEDCVRVIAEWQEKAQAASRRYDDLNRKLQGYCVSSSSIRHQSSYCKSPYQLPYS